MIISDIEYHFVMPLSIEDQWKPKMKNDLNIIIPDILVEYSGTVQKLLVKRDYVQIHLSAAANHSPKFIAEDIATKASTRLIRLHRELKGFDRIFKENIYIKTGTKPSKKKVEDVFFIASTGI